MTIPAKNAKSLDLSTSLGAEVLEELEAVQLVGLVAVSFQRVPTPKKGYPDQKRRKDAEIFFPQHFFMF